VSLFPPSSWKQRSAYIPTPNQLRNPAFQEKMNGFMLAIRATWKRVIQTMRKLEQAQWKKRRPVTDINVLEDEITMLGQQVKRAWYEEFARIAHVEIAKYQQSLKTPPGPNTDIQAITTELTALRTKRQFYQTEIARLDNLIRPPRTRRETQATLATPRRKFIEMATTLSRTTTAVPFTVATIQAQTVSKHPSQDPAVQTSMLLRDLWTQSDRAVMESLPNYEWYERELERTVSEHPYCMTLTTA